MTLKGKIIWIDDDDDLIYPQKENLEGDGYKVEIISDVDEAIQLIRDKPNEFRGAIVDVMMDPGKELRNENHDAGFRTGLVLCQLLRNERRCPPPKLFIFTHREDPEAARDFRKLGINYYKKQHYKGRAICDLVREEFDKDE